MTFEEQVLKTEKLAAQSSARYTKRLAELRRKMRNSCKHTKTDEYTWEHDNGYGRQTKHVGKRCLACLKRQHWPGYGVWAEEWYSNDGA